MVYEWKDTPVSVSIFVEKTDKKDLPKFIGRSSSLDNKIAHILQDISSDYIWLYKNKKDLYFIAKNLYPFFKTDSIIINIIALSTGYYDGGCINCHPDNAYPPEGEDYRVISSVTLTNEEGNIYPISEEYFDLFEDQFGNEIYEPEIDLRNI
jgi:hypothetical protein